MLHVHTTYLRPTLNTTINPNINPNLNANCCSYLPLLGPLVRQRVTLEHHHVRLCSRAPLYWVSPIPNHATPPATHPASTTASRFQSLLISLVLSFIPFLHNDNTLSSYCQDTVFKQLLHSLSSLTQQRNGARQGAAATEHGWGKHNLHQH